MNKKIIKIISIVLCALMAISSFSVLFTVFASPVDDTNVSNDELIVLENPIDSEDGENSEEVVTKTVEEPVEDYVKEEKETEDITEEKISESLNNKEADPEILPSVTNMTIVNLNVEEDYGNIVVKFKNEDTNETYEVILYYINDSYSGTTTMPVGTYEIITKDNENVKLKVNESKVNLLNLNAPINLTVNTVKNNDNGVWEFIKNNAFVLILLIGVLIFYGVYKKKTSLLEKR